MKIIDWVLYIEFAELADLGISGNTLRAGKARKSKEWVAINDPADRRKVLFDYDYLKAEYKQLIHSRYGNPYEYAVKQQYQNKRLL